LIALEQQITDLSRLRDDLRALLTEWDATLAGTAAGRPARLLDGLASRATIEQGRRKRATLPSATAGRKI